MTTHLFLAAALIAQASAPDKACDPSDVLAAAPVVVLAEVVAREDDPNGGVLVSADVVRLVRGLAGTRVSFEVPDAASAPLEGRTYLLFLQQDRASQGHLPASPGSWIEVSAGELAAETLSPALEAIAGTSLDEASARITALGRKQGESPVEVTDNCGPIPPGCNGATCINQGWWEIGFEGTADMPITITNLTTGSSVFKTGTDMGPSWKLLSTQGTCGTYFPRFFVDNGTHNDCHIPESAQAVVTFNTVTYRIQFGSLGKVLFQGSSTQCAGGGLDAVYKVSASGVQWRWGSQNHQIWGWPDGCVSAADCNDGLFCTQDVCTNGLCSHPPISCTSPEPYCYTASCDESADQCALTPTPNFDVPFPCGNHWCLCI